jgi:hypothetical protein
VLFGVCGGLGRYLNIDPVVLRIITIALIFAGVGVDVPLLGGAPVALAVEIGRESGGDRG